MSWPEALVDIAGIVAFVVIMWIFFGRDKD